MDRGKAELAWGCPGIPAGAYAPCPRAQWPSGKDGVGKGVVCWLCLEPGDPQEGSCWTRTLHGLFWYLIQMRHVRQGEGGLSPPGVGGLASEIPCRIQGRALG